MKQLILRDLYLIRKNLLITFGIFAGLFLMGFLIALSARFGNIARYVSDKDSISDIVQVSLYFSIVAGIILASAEDHIQVLINKDYKNGWHQYMMASGVKQEKIIGVRFLLIFVIFLISILISIGEMLLMQAVAGESLKSLFHTSLGYHEGTLLLAYGSLFCLMTGDFFTLIEYIYKGKNSTKADIIKVMPIMIILLSFSVVVSIMGETGQLEEYMKKLTELTPNLKLLYMLPILWGIAITIICYFISVRIVKKEGRHV